MGVNINMLEEQLKNCNLSDKSEEFINNKQSSSANLNKSLSRYSINLTEKAILGKLDPVIERNSELQRMIQILCRRTKNNPCLIGEPGVGKTAVVEGLAIKIAKNDVPPQLALKQILSLDLTGMIAGTRYRGDFEDRLSTVINEIKSKYDLVIYLANVETASNQTTVRLDWVHLMAADAPWFVKDIPTMFISLANPYHLVDVPMIKTFINGYSSSEYIVDAVIEKITGKSEFKGISPVDPFCNVWGARL